jgi:hypothetical protein
VRRGPLNGWPIVGWATLAVVAVVAAILAMDGSEAGVRMAIPFIAAMTATSFDRTAAWLGPRRWQRLHTVGGWLVWFIFFQSFNLQAPKRPILVPFALLIDAVPAVRMLAARAARARRVRGVPRSRVRG